MTRAATYARFSTDKQTETSIDDQRRACREYAAAHGMTIVNEFSDLAISGASFGNRPGVLAMQKAAFANELDVIIIADLTRLSRNSADLPKFLERMRFRKIRVIGVLDRFDSDMRVARMQAGLSGIMSDEYRAAVGERVHLALDTLAKNSKPTGSKAFGYTSKQTVIPEQAALVREIFRRIAAGETLKAVVSDFNGRNVPSPGATWKRVTRRGDGRWIVPALNALVQNEVYVGRVIWNRSQWVKDPETGRRTRRERPRAEWIIDERPELAIVDRETWDIVARKMQQRKHSKGHGGAPSRYALSGLLECGVCGGKFIMSGGGKNGRGYGIPGAKYYACSTFHQGGIHACTNRLRVLREVAEEKLFTPALEQLLSPAAIDEAVRRIRKMLKDAPPAPDASSVAAIDAKILKIRALVASGALDSELSEPIYAKLDAEKVSAMRSAQRATMGPVVSGPWGFEAEYREQAKRLRDDLTGGDAAAARAALRTIYGERIRLIPDGNILSAEIRLQANAVMLANGTAPGRIQLSSGGLQCDYIPLIR